MSEREVYQGNRRPQNSSREFPGISEILAGITGNFVSFVFFPIFSERELKFMFAICHRRSVCLSVVCLSVVCLSVTLVHPTQAIEIFGNISTPCGTLAIHELCI